MRERGTWEREKTERERSREGERWGGSEAERGGGEGERAVL